MTKLEVGKEYWFKGHVIDADEGEPQPYEIQFGDENIRTNTTWIADDTEVSEVFPEREKVTIPKEVAEWIEEHKDQFSTVYTAFRILVERDYGIKKWVNENQDNFARAWLDGYKIEKEPLYWVRDNKGKSILYKDVEAGCKVTRSGGSNVSHQEEYSVKYTFTEQEIKAYDERFWAFRVEVTDD